MGRKEEEQRQNRLGQLLCWISKAKTSRRGESLVRNVSRNDSGTDMMILTVSVVLD